MKKDLLRATAIICAAFCLALSLTTAPALAKDSNGELVRIAQMRLTDLGYHTGNFDGKMGQVTENAIRDFQRNSGLAVTGQLTPETFTLLTRGDRVGSGTARYQAYDNYYRAYADHYRTLDYAPIPVSTTSVDWDNHWHAVRNQDLPLRFAHLNVREEYVGTLRQYTITLNGHDIMFANNQPGVLRATETFALYNEDAIIFTASQGAGVCPNKSYLLVVHSDGTFNRPAEIGNCAGSFEAHVSNNALFVSFPGVNLIGGWQTWGTWRYENDVMVRI